MFHEQYQCFLFICPGICAALHYVDYIAWLINQASRQAYALSHSIAIHIALTLPLFTRLKSMQYQHGLVLTEDERYKTESYRTVHSAGESTKCWHRQKIMMLFMLSPDRKWPVIHHPPVNIMTRAFSLHSLFILHKNITRLQTREESQPLYHNGYWSMVGYCMDGKGQTWTQWGYEQHKLLSVYTPVCFMRVHIRPDQEGLVLLIYVSWG